MHSAVTIAVKMESEINISNEMSIFIYEIVSKSERNENVTKQRSNHPNGKDETVEYIKWFYWFFAKEARIQK